MANAVVLVHSERRGDGLGETARNWTPASGLLLLNDALLAAAGLAG